MSLHQELFSVWNNFYTYRKGCKYRWSIRDERHLKNIRVAIEDQIINVCKASDVQQKDDLILSTFRAFLGNIKDSWILSNLELRLIDTKFNSLWANLNRKFPNYYDKDYEKQLEKDSGMDAVIKYHKHLKSIGWILMNKNMGPPRWFKPQLNGN